MFLVVVDARSKWLDVRVTNAATSTTTIDMLRTKFATHSIPDIIVSDNCSVFTSGKFEDFTRRNEIKHVKTAPYHPASNGLAERAVQSFKAGLKKQVSGSIQARVDRFLFQYRITPHTTTGIPPAEVLTHCTLVNYDVTDKSTRNN